MASYSLWVPAAGAFTVTVGAILALRRIALHVDLVDRPGGRKSHAGAVPLVGGLGMVFGVAFGLAACGAGAGAGFGSLQQFLYSAVLLAIVGALDDGFALSPGVRLFTQVVAVLPMFFADGIRITTFGDLFGTGPLDVGGISLPVTAFVTVAAINAFNLLDGVDGLVGCVALTALMVFLSLVPAGPVAANGAVAVVLAACVAGFLVFNIPVPWDNSAYKCFMGDAGSTMLGFSLAWLMIGSSQGLRPLLEPVTALWIVLVPAVDLLWAVLRRLVRRQSLLRADGEHLHHMLARAGLGSRAVVAVLTGLSLLAGLVGVRLEHAGVPAWGSFALWLASGAVLVLATTLRARPRRLA